MHEYQEQQNITSPHSGDNADKSDSLKKNWKK